MCEFCDARIYRLGSAGTHDTFLHASSLRMKHAGRSEWELHVIDSYGEPTAVFPVLYCPMCGRKLKKED